MLSKKMYAVISCFPRNYGPIEYFDIVKTCSLREDEIKDCFAEAEFLPISYYRKSPKTTWDKSTFYLSEAGLAEIDSYEQMEQNQQATIKALSVAKIAMWAAIASAIAAIAALIKMFL